MQRSKGELTQEPRSRIIRSKTNSDGTCRAPFSITRFQYRVAKDSTSRWSHNSIPPNRINLSLHNPLTNTSIQVLAYNLELVPMQMERMFTRVPIENCNINIVEMIEDECVCLGTVDLG
jgi:predicted helicase